jgi:hypothetical protein
MTVPFRLWRDHFMIEKRDESYYVRDLCSTLGTIVNGDRPGHLREGWLVPDEHPTGCGTFCYAALDCSSRQGLSVRCY